MTSESTINNRGAIALYNVEQDEVLVFIEKNGILIHALCSITVACPTWSVMPILN
jgi:hypothetical protein